MDVAALLHDYGYPAIVAGTFFEGESVLIAAGALAQRGLLEWPWVYALGALGGFIGDQTWFAVGRWFGPRLIDRRPKLQAARDKMNALMTRGDAWIVMGIRFMYGLRVGGPIVIGASRISWGRYAFFNAIGALVWAGVICAGGYALGASIASASSQWRLVTIGIAAFAVIAIGVWFWRRRGRLPD